MPDNETELPVGSDEAQLLVEMRDKFAYLSDRWRPSREQRAVDLRYLQGDPWEPEDRKAREDPEVARPCISHDELNQYTNQACNNVRQNKRGIKVGPDGNGASEKTAELQESIVRGIEKRTAAPQTYCATFQNMIEGGYGFFRITREYLPGRTFNQRVSVAPVPNPDSVLCDWDCKEPDWSDQRDCFIVDGNFTHDEFRRRWPRAKVQSFGPEELRIASDWVRPNTVLVCEWWRVESDWETLYELPGGKVVTDQELNGRRYKRTRQREIKSLVQRFTNGVEILETTDQTPTLPDGSPCDDVCIPIIPMIGLERWVDRGSGATREINSAVRLARDPQMTLAYLCSQEMEEAGLSPKVPYVGYVGQFESDKDTWDTLTKVPHSHAQVDPMVDGMTGQVLPHPVRQQFTPNFQAYEVAKDSARRAIQAAMGISPLPTAAQRNNEKSGVALEKIRESQDIGGYHFVDAFDRALVYAGRVMLAWIRSTYDTEREEVLHNKDGSHKVAQLNTPDPVVDMESGDSYHYVVSQGNHYPDISTGPSYQSQRDEAAQFLDTLLQNLKGLPVPPQQAAKLLSIAIKMRDLGPLGDEMAEIVSPDQNGQIPPQAQAQMEQMKQHSAALYAYVQQLQGELQKMQLEAKAKVIDNEYKLKLERMRIEAGITEAEIETKAQQASERTAFVADMTAQFHDQAHDAALQADQQAHEQGLADQQQAHEQGLADQQADLQQQAQQQQGNDNENS